MIVGAVFDKWFNVMIAFLNAFDTKNKRYLT